MAVKPEQPAPEGIAQQAIKKPVSPRLTLRYATADVAADGLVTRAGESLHGHEFHRTRVHVDDTSSVTTRAWGWRHHDGEAQVEGLVAGSVHASYLHTHWAGRPQSATALVRAATGVLA